MNFSGKYAGLPGRWRLMKTGGTSLFRKTMAVIRMFPKTASAKAATLRLKCTYHQCRNTPLSVFIDFSHGNTNALRRFPLAGQNTLQLAGAMLMHEFSTLCGEKRGKFPGVDLMKQRLRVRRLQELIAIAEATRDFITHANNEAMLKIKDLVGFDCSKSLKPAENTLKLWIIDLEVAEKAFEKETEKAKKEEYNFQILVTDVSKYMGFQIDRLRTTVAEFAGYVCSMRKEIDRNRQKNIRSKK